MEIKYKIIELRPDEHSVVVRYYTDACPPEASAYDTLGGVLRCRTDFIVPLPIPLPDADVLQRLIMSRAPVDFFATKEKVADPAIDTSMDALKGLVDQEFSAVRGV